VLCSTAVGDGLGVVLAEALGDADGVAVAAPGSGAGVEVSVVDGA
jgi:hypothetical protein